MALIDLAISVAFYDVHSYSGPILISPGPQEEAGKELRLFDYCP